MREEDAKHNWRKERRGRIFIRVHVTLSESTVAAHNAHLFSQCIHSTKHTVYIPIKFVHKNPLKPIIRYIFGDFAFEQYFAPFVYLCICDSLSSLIFCLFVLMLLLFRFVRFGRLASARMECLLGNSIIFNFDAVYFFLHFSAFDSLCLFHTFALDSSFVVCTIQWLFQLQGASILVVYTYFFALYCSLNVLFVLRNIRME